MTASRGGFNQRRLPTLAMLTTVSEIAAMIKRWIEGYERWTWEGDISAHRPCPAEGCGCRFRHRHGWVARAVVGGGWEGQVRLLRLFCPRCAATEALSPDWLRSHSPYPWPWQEAAALQYAGGPEGYRKVAARFGVDYTVLWGWVRPLAAVAVDVVGVVIRELLGQDPGADLNLAPVAHGIVLQKAWTAEKRQGLAHLPLLAQAAGALRRTCRDRADLSEDAEPVSALGWLSRYLPVHGAPRSLWLQFHRRSHSVLAPAAP